MFHSEFLEWFPTGVLEEFFAGAVVLGIPTKCLVRNSSRNIRTNPDELLRETLGRLLGEILRKLGHWKKLWYANVSRCVSFAEKLLRKTWYGKTRSFEDDRRGIHAESSDVFR